MQYNTPVRTKTKQIHPPLRNLKRVNLLWVISNNSPTAIFDRDLALINSSSTAAADDVPHNHICGQNVRTGPVTASARLSRTHPGQHEHGEGSDWVWKRGCGGAGGAVG